VPAGRSTRIAEVQKLHTLPNRGRLTDRHWALGPAFFAMGARLTCEVDPSQVANDPVEIEEGAAHLSKYAAPFFLSPLY